MNAESPHSHAPPTRLLAWSICAIAGIAFLVALAMRLAVLHQVADIGFMDRPLSDARIYAERAAGIASGDWLGDESFVHAPLYAYLLAPFAWAGGAAGSPSGAAPTTGYAWLDAVRLAQCLLGALACALLVPTAVIWARPIRTIPSTALPAIAAIAGLGLALYPPAIFYDLLIQKTTVDLILSVALLALLGIAWNQSDPATPRPRTLALWALIGILLGLFTLNRQNALALAALLIAMPIASAWAEAPRDTRRASRALKHAAPAIGIAILALALTLLPWAARNRAVLADWVISTPNLGQNLLMGNRPDATGTYLPSVRGKGTAEYEQEVWVRQAERAAGRELTPDEVSDFYRDEAIDWITSHPAQWTALTAHKTALLLNAFEAPDTEDLYLYATRSPLLRATERIMHFGILLPLAMLGIALTIRNWRSVAPLWAWLGITGATIVVFVVFGRYRFPMVPALWIFAALGIALLARALRARLRANTTTNGGPIPEPPIGNTHLVLSIGAAVAAGALANQTVLHPRAPQPFSFVNHAAVLADLGRTDEALLEAERAIALDPASPDAHAICASIAMDQSRHTDAIAGFREAIRLDPQFAGAWTGLGNAMLAAGQTDSAIDAYQQSLALLPDDPTTLSQLGAALARSGREPQAAELIEQAITLDPDNPIALHNLGALRILQGRGAEAIDPLRRAIALEPQRRDAHLALIAAHFNAGQTDQSIDAAMHAWRSFPTDPRIQQTLFEVLLRAQRFEEALEALQDIREQDPSAAWTDAAERQLRESLRATGR
ncbi:MAG: tetratricopeptide repeat protein [Phycisphaerales bacterium]